MTTNYNIGKGDTLNIRLTVTDADGAAFNLTGATVTIVVVDRNGTEKASVDVTNHTNASGGITTVSIPDTTTSTWVEGAYEYDVTVYPSNGETFQLQYGVIDVEPSR